MQRRWALGFGVGLLVSSAGGIIVFAESQTSQTSAQTDLTSLSGTVTAVNLDDLHPSITVGDGLGNNTDIMVDRASTRVVLQGAGGQLSDLAVGQHVLINGRYMHYAGQLVAKSITVAQIEKVAEPATLVKATTDSDTKSRSAPRSLRSIPESEKSQTSQDQKAVGSKQ